MEDIKRVFFHELGHFIAREINHKYYNGQGTKSISIYPYPHNDELFLGDTKINLSANGKEKESPSKQELAEYLASSTYGCIFQAYYQKTSLKQCFDNNGGDDLNKWFGALLSNDLDWLNSDIASADREHFDSLNEKGELDDMMKLIPQDYLIDNGNQNFEINIPKLQEDTFSFIEKHFSIYQKLIEKYSEIVSQME